MVIVALQTDSGARGCAVSTELLAFARAVSGSVPTENARADETPSPPIHTSTIYTAASGATVFSAGTFLWSLALDGYRGPDYREEYTPVDARIAQMTKNLFDRLGDGPTG